MYPDNLAQLGLTLARGDAALWLGPEWKEFPPGYDLDSLTKVRWLGVWSEFREATSSAALDRKMREQEDRRLLIGTLSVRHRSLQRATRDS